MIPEIYRRALTAAQADTKRPLRAAHQIFWWGGYGYASKELAKLVVHQLYQRENS